MNLLSEEHGATLETNGLAPAFPTRRSSGLPASCSNEKREQENLSKKLASEQLRDILQKTDLLMFLARDVRKTAIAELKPQAEQSKIAFC